MRISNHFEKIKDKIPEHNSDIELTEDLKRCVMSSIDVKGILESWNVSPVLRGSQWNGYCPDHFIHAGRTSHAPKWTMDADTGDCTCFTGNTSSNIVYIAKRLYNLKTIEEAINKLTNGGGIPYIPPEFIMNERRKERTEENEKEREKKLNSCLRRINSILSKRHLSDECIKYFSEDGINLDTLEFLCVSSVENGYYEGRAIIPFVNEKRKVCGYVAVNYMGKEWMVRRNVDNWCKLNGKEKIVEAMDYFDKNYRKTMFCPGFKSRDHLYGYYEVINGDKNLESLVIVEGERDAIKLLQEGIDCVSIHGTTLKDEQKVLIKKINPQKLFLGFDMDKAGNQATIDAYNVLSCEVDKCFVLNFPDGKDPKKFNKKELDYILNIAEANRVQEREKNEK